MADAKISALTGATTPLGGTEVVPVVQSSSTKKVSIANLTAGRAVSGLSFATTNVTVGASAVTAGTDISYSVNSGATQTVSAAYTTGSFRPALKMSSVGANHDMILQFTDLCRFYNAAGDTKFYVDHLNSKVGSSYNLAFDNGTGIDFSATPGTGTSELLSDYEEGNYTGTLTPSTSGTITVNALADRMNYTKIGRVVYISGFLEVGSVSSPVGTDVLLNLPFAISNLAKDSSRFGTAVFADGAVRALTGYNSGTVVYITMTASLVAAGDQFYISFNYIAA